MLGDPAADLPPRFPGSDLGQDGHAFRQMLGAELATSGQHRRELAQALRVGEGLEQKQAQGLFSGTAAVVALDLGPDPLDQAVVLNPGGAGSHASHASEAAVEMGDHLFRELLGLVQAGVHEHNPAARGVGLLGPQDIGGT